MVVTASVHPCSTSIYRTVDHPPDFSGSLTEHALGQMSRFLWVEEGEDLPQSLELRLLALLENRAPLAVIAVTWVCIGSQMLAARLKALRAILACNSSAVLSFRAGRLDAYR